MPNLMTLLKIDYVYYPKQGHARLHGTGSTIQGHSLRLFGRLVLVRLHALQIVEGPQSLPTAQNQGQARDRPNDHDYGTLRGGGRESTVNRGR